MTEPDIALIPDASPDGHQDEAPGGTPVVTDVVTGDGGGVVTSEGASDREPDGGVVTDDLASAHDRGTEIAAAALHLAGYWYALGVADATRHGGLLRTAWEGHGESLAERSDYASRRGWLPEGHPGGRLVTGIPLAYYRSIAPAGVA